MGLLIPRILILSVTIASIFFSALQFRGINRESIVEGFFYLTEEHLLKLTQADLRDAVGLRNITPQYLIPDSTGIRGFFEVLSKNKSSVGFSVVIFEDLPCAYCRDVLVLLVFSKRGRLLSVKPIMKWEVRGKPTSAREFFQQFLALEFPEDAFLGSTIKALTGATISSRFFTDRIRATARFLQSLGIFEQRGDKS